MEKSYLWNLHMQWFAYVQDIISTMLDSPSFVTCHCMHWCLWLFHLIVVYKSTTNSCTRNVNSFIFFMLLNFQFFHKIVTFLIFVCFWKCQAMYFQ